MAEALPAIWLESIKPQAHHSKDYVELFNLLCSTDWATISPELGALSHWPLSLRALVQLMFASPIPQSLRWGKKLNIIYNVAFWREIVGEKHPKLMGQELEDLWPQREGLKNPANLIAEVMRTGQAAHSPESLWFLDKGTARGEQENYISLWATPIFDDNSKMIGCFNTHEISTNRVIHLRRASSLRNFIEATQDAISMCSLQIKLQHAFNLCEFDFPMCLVMLKDSFLDGSMAESPGDTCLSDDAAAGKGKVKYQCFLKAGMNELLSERIVNFKIDPSGEDQENKTVFSRIARQCHLVKESVFFQEQGLTKYCLGRAFGKGCHEARLSPIYAPDHAENPNIEPMGYVLLGFSPCTPVDEAAQQYARTVENLITSAFQSVGEVMRSQARLSQVKKSRQAGERYFRIVDNSPIGISLQNWKTREVMFANTRWRDILGYAQDTPIDDWASLILDDDVPGVYNALQSMNPSDPIKDHQVRLKRQHSNGKPAWVTLSCGFHHDVLDADDVIIWLSTAVADISQQVYAQEKEMAMALETERLQTARRREQERADLADRAKARQLDYIDTLAHEIRNPISAVIQSVEVLVERLQGLGLLDEQNNKDIQQSIEDLGTIDICTSHMSTVIDDALNISKLEHGSLAVTPQDCHLLSHIQSVLRMLQQDMKNKGIHCKDVEIDPTWSDHIESVVTDPLRYKQVILNLLTNAIKFTAMQTGKKQISVKLYSEPDPSEFNRRFCYCSITDSGSGMSEETVSKLFGKFYQGGNRTHVEYQGSGSGLGLYISQRLATLLGGKIEVDSKLSSGSTFTFSISAKLSPIDCQCDSSVDKLVSQNSVSKALKRGFEDVTTNRPGSPPITPSPSPHQLPTLMSPGTNTSQMLQTPGTILVVEDNLINQKLLVKQLRTSGYHVLVGNHGLEALEYFKQGCQIDLVLTDIEMPLMDGIECMRAVKALELPHTPPFVACSAYARAEQRVSFLKAGMLDVVSKPYRFAELKPRIAAIMLSQQKERFTRPRENTI